MKSYFELEHLNGWHDAFNGIVAGGIGKSLSFRNSEWGFLLFSGFFDDTFWCGEDEIDDIKD